MRTTFPMTGRPETANPPEDEEKLLVLLRGALGDVLLTLPFLAALPVHFGVQSLTLVGRRTILELLASQPFVSLIMDHDQAEWAGLYQDPPRIPARLSRRLLSHKGAIVLTKASSDPALCGLKKLGLKFVLAVPSRAPLGSKTHVTDHMFAASGVEPFPEPVSIRPTLEALDRAAAFLESKRLDHRSWLALHPGSGGIKKNWNLDQWIELAGELHKRLGFDSLFVLGPAEAGFGEIIERKLGPQKTFLAQDLPLPFLAALLSLSRGYIGHDSGVTHLSAKLGLPTVAIFGPTDPACWAPRGPKVEVLSPPMKPDPRAIWDWLNSRQILQALQKIY